MSKSKPTGIEHIKKTLPIKKIQGQDLTIDVYYTKTPPRSPRPALLYFHGGFLVLLSSPPLPFNPNSQTPDIRRLDCPPKLAETSLSPTKLDSNLSKLPLPP